ncbi:unnamed protein product [Prorocentrum cordatum]|uniref:Uncharacterized protein n=1 Tax=Prorocentrum cordatum TaxID=2364126 RepID=A0ABN9WFE8_9DINO|nr:unnamed protein product [Polarella glacialis]
MGADADLPRVSTAPPGAARRALSARGGRARQPQEPHGGPRGPAAAGSRCHGAEDLSASPASARLPCATAAGGCRPHSQPCRAEQPAGAPRRAASARRRAAPGERGGSLIPRSMGADLDQILQGLEQLDSEVAAIKARHRTFLEDREPHPKGAHPGPQGQAAGQAAQPQSEGRRPSVGGERKGKPGSPRAATQDADASRELEPHPPSARRRQQKRRALTPAQMRAMSSFAQIDTGKVPREHVFHSVPGAERRVETRLEYFRHREDQVTKRVGVRWRIYTSQLETGELVIDVFKLLRAPRLGLGGKGVRASSSASQACREAPGALDEHPGRVTPPQGCRAEAAERPATARTTAGRAAGTDAAGRRRDARADSVREHGRRLQLERRLQQLDDQQHKASRRATADRDRVLLGWVAAAIAAETMQRLRRAYAQIAAASGGGGEAVEVRACPGSPTQSHWRRVVSRSPGGAALAPPLQAALAGVLRRRRELERRARLRGSAQRAWRRAAAAARFLVAMQRRARCDRAVETIKDFLEAAWGENRTMHAMKTYLRRIRMMQRCFRAALKFRQHVCKYIYLPAVWEMETRILGKALGVNHRALDDEIDGHRRALDRELREREAQALSDARFPKSHRPKRSSECGSVAGSVGGRRVRNQAILSAHGRALGHNKRHGLGDDVEQHRLSVAERTIIVKGLLRQGTARYWLAHDDYVLEMREFNIEWKQWRLEAQSLGQEFRDSWPPVPIAPVPPAEMLKLDMPPLRDKVLSMLKLTKGGHLFLPAARWRIFVFCFKWNRSRESIRRAFPCIRIRGRAGCLSSLLLCCTEVWPRTVLMQAHLSLFVYLILIGART